jgi:hypothetical protein
LTVRLQEEEVVVVDRLAQHQGVAVEEEGLAYRMMMIMRS